MNRILATIVVILSMLILFLYNGYRNRGDELSSLSVRYSEKIDSLITEANKEPIVVVKDTTIYKDTIIYKHKKIYAKIDSVYNVYTDSIKNDSIDAKIKVLANKVYEIEWEYSPVYKVINTSTYIPKPVPVIEYVSKYENKRSLYLDAGIGFSDAFVGKVGLSYLDKKNASYSVDLVRYSNKNIYLFSYGIKIR